MKQAHKLVAGIVASLGLGVAVATAYAQPGHGDGEESHRHGSMQQSAKGAMQHGAKGGMSHGATGGMRHGAAETGTPGQGAAHSLMTPEERTALHEKMRSAKTPEERQQLAATTRTEMQERAKEKGITLPKGHGPRSGIGHAH